MIGPVSDAIAARFDSFESRGRRSCEYCAPYEAELEIFVARGLYGSVSEAWAALKRYQ